MSNHQHFSFVLELWICRFLYVRQFVPQLCIFGEFRLVLHVCGSHRLCSQMKESHLSPLLSSPLSSRNVKSLHQASFIGCCLHYLLAAPPLSPPAVCLPAACRLPSPAPMTCPASLTLPPPLLLLTLPGLLPCAYPLFSLLASLQRTVTVRAISMDST